MDKKKQPGDPIRDCIGRLGQLCGVQLQLPEQKKRIRRSWLTGRKNGALSDEDLHNLLLQIIKALENQQKALRETRNKEMNSQAKTDADRVKKDKLPEDGDLWWIGELISMRDRLQQQQSFCSSLDPAQAQIAEKLISQQLRETEALLKKRQVEVLDETGTFHAEFQTVVLTQPAPSEDLEEQISLTVRPGYRYKGRIIRAQEVAVYVKGEG